MSVKSETLWRVGRYVVIGVVIAGVAGGLFATRSQWMPEARQWLSGADSGEQDAEDDAPADAPMDATQSVVLSLPAMRSIDFEPWKLELDDFDRTIVVPAAVIDRPGFSQVHVTTPLTGIVSEIFVMAGAAVEPGQLMFEIRLTHEDLVELQRDFLATHEDLAVVDTEIVRLEAITDGIIAGKRILELGYEKRRLLAKLHADRQALLLHGLTSEQLDLILDDRELRATVQVYAPSHTGGSNHCSFDHPFHIQDLPVKLGEQVSQGQSLAVLADHCELLVEGRAFEDDAEYLQLALREQRDLTLRRSIPGRSTEQLDNYRLLFLADHIDPESHAYRFYIRLPNEVVLDRSTEKGHRFVTWRFNPGQRMDVEIPVETWKDQLVVPIDAIVDEGVETFVYKWTLSRFEQVAVHVKYRDQDWAVISNDGSIRPGERIAGRGAFQIHLTLQNQASGGVDMSHGHPH